MRRTRNQEADRLTGRGYPERQRRRANGHDPRPGRFGGLRRALPAVPPPRAPWPAGGRGAAPTVSDDAATPQQQRAGAAEQQTEPPQGGGRQRRDLADRGGGDRRRVAPRV